MTPLVKIEDEAARSIALVTGCNADALKAALRKHHHEKKLDPDTKLRANPGGGQPDPFASTVLTGGEI